MEGGPRRNSSSDMMNAAQVSIPAIRMTIQEASMIGTCLINIREGRKPKNIYGKTATIALNALQLFFWLHLYGKTVEQYYLGYHNSQKTREGA